MIGRLIILAATVGGGLFLGRKKINAEIEKKLPEEIERARIRAIEELDRQTDDIIGERLLSFIISLVIKAGLIGSVYWLYLIGYLSSEGLRLVSGVFISAFIVRDTLKISPLVLPAFKLLKDAGWNIRFALIEFIASLAFERAHDEAMRLTGKGRQHGLLRLSRYSPEGVSSEIAQAVADVTRHTAFNLIRIRVIIATVTAAAMIGAYWSFFMLTINVD